MLSHGDGVRPVRRMGQDNRLVPHQTVYVGDAGSRYGKECISLATETATQPTDTNRTETEGWRAALPPTSPSQWPHSGPFQGCTGLRACGLATRSLSPRGHEKPKVRVDRHLKPTLRHRPQPA